MANSRFIISKEILGELQIFVSLFFFAVSFVGQKQAMINGMLPITYNAFRFIISTLVLVFIKYGAGISIERELNEDELQIHSSFKKADITASKAAKFKTLIIYGIILGLANFGGSAFQQLGLVTVTAGKTGFITGMYVVFVPIAEYLFPYFNSKLSMRAIFAAAFSLFGLYLLSGCAEEEKCIGGALKEGDFFVFVSVFFWVASIMFCDIGAKEVEVISLQMIDFVVTTIFTIFLAFYMEPSSWYEVSKSVYKNWHLIVLVGISEALAFTLSSLGQIYSTPSRAALLYSLEAVSCAVFAYFFLDETLTYIELLGALIMFLAALLTSSSEEEEEKEADKRGLIDELDQEAEIPILYNATNYKSCNS